MPTTHGPFNVIAATPDKVTIYQNHIRNKVSVDRCTKHPANEDTDYTQGPPAQKSNTTTSQDANGTQTPTSIDATEEHDLLDRPNALTDAAQPHRRPPTLTLVLSRLVHHVYVAEKAVYTDLYTDGSTRPLQMHEVDLQALT